MEKETLIYMAFAVIAGGVLMYGAQAFKAERLRRRLSPVIDEMILDNPHLFS